ncbi:MAG TPA: alpha/beta hydrolase [Ktedonobacterales bacterium]
MTTGFVNVNGARLWYEDSGGEGHAVTFVHAGICDHRQWDTQWAPFSEKYRVIRFDMRGFGQSDLPAGPASLSDDIGGLLDALGVRRSAVIGCSMGGSASLDFALKQPERVSALVLVGSGMSGRPGEVGPEEAAIIEEMDAAEKAGDDEKLNALELRLWVDGPKRAPEQVTPGVRDLVAEMNGENIRRAAEWEQVTPQPLEPPAAGRLSEIHAPTLLIVGSDDTFGVRKTMEALEAGVADARLVVMPGLTHVPNMERPQEFNQTVLGFLGPIW